MSLNINWFCFLLNRLIESNQDVQNDQNYFLCRVGTRKTKRNKENKRVESPLE